MVLIFLLFFELSKGHDWKWIEAIIQKIFHQNLAKDKEQALINSFEL